MEQHDSDWSRSTIGLVPSLKRDVDVDDDETRNKFILFVLGHTMYHHKQNEFSSSRPKIKFYLLKNQNTKTTHKKKYEFQQDTSLS